MRRMYFCAITLIIITLLVSCSNQNLKTEIGLESINLSLESKAILKSMEPNKNISDYILIFTTIDKLPKDSEKQLVNNINSLIEQSNNKKIFA